MGGKWDYLKEAKKGKEAAKKGRDTSTSHKGHVSLTRQRGVWAVRLKASSRALQAWPLANACFPRAPLVFFNRIRASELWIRIHLQITNRYSLTLKEDYETLIKGWEFISESDDEDNSMNYEWEYKVA